MMVVLGAACIYFLAHVMRALRFWLLYGDVHVSISKTLRMFYLLSIAGLFLPLPAVEVCKALGLMGVCRSAVRTVMAYAVYRTLDLLGLALLLGAIYSFSPSSRPWVEQEIPWPPFLGLCAAGLLLLAVFASTRAALFPLQNYLLRRHHSGLGTRLLRFLCRCANTSEILAASNDRFLLTPLLLTVLGWMLDVAALHLILPHIPLGALAPTWMGDSVTTLLSMTPASQTQRGVIAQQLFLPQACLAGGLLLFWLVARVRQQKRTRGWQGRGLRFLQGRRLSFRSAA